MSVNASQPETVAQQVYRHGLMGIASGGIGDGVSDALGIEAPGDPVEAVDVTGLHGSHLGDGTVMHHGPTVGGDLLERPSAGYMAHAAADQSLELDRTGDVSSIARQVDQAGRLTVDGQTYEVLDYLPGGDLVQAAAGHADPTQLAMTLAQFGLKARMADDRSGTIELAGHAGNVTGRDGGTAGDGGPAAGDGSPEGGRDAIGGPDADQDWRDREELAVRHRMDMDTAVETSDSSRVHTEIHAHGRTLEIDTDFEARARDNHAERAESEEHVRGVAHAARDETESTAPDMRFRSRVHAHLDAAAKDEGLAI